MLVYRRREPHNSSKYKYKQVGRDLFFYAGGSTFSFLSLSSWAAWKTIFCALTFLTYVGKRNKLFLVLFRIFLTAFPFEKDGCQHSSSSPFLAGNHEYMFEDWRERTKKITGLSKTRCLSRKSPVYFFRISFSYNVFVLYFPFQFEIKQCAILLPWKLFLSNESRSFCTRLFLFWFINRNRNTAQKEYALSFLGVEFLLQLIPFFTQTLNSLWPKTYGKKDMENMKNHRTVCPPPQNQKEDNNPSGSYHSHLRPFFFFEDFGVFRRQICSFTSGRVDNCVRKGQRPYACMTISGSGVRSVANARHYRELHILFLDEKGLVRSFPATFVWFYLKK